MTDHTTAAQAAKQETVLTDEEIAQCAWGYFEDHRNLPDFAEPFARAIESALLSKLRAPVAGDAQPVAYLHKSNLTLTWPGKLNEVQLASGVWRPLYDRPAAPQASEALRDALWTLTEHNALHFGEQHSTVIQGRAALSAQPGAQKECSDEA